MPRPGPCAISARGAASALRRVHRDTRRTGRSGRNAAKSRLFSVASAGRDPPGRRLPISSGGLSLSWVCWVTAPRRRSRSRKRCLPTRPRKAQLGGAAGQGHGQAGFRRAWQVRWRSCRPSANTPWPALPPPRWPIPARIRHSRSCEAGKCGGLLLTTGHLNMVLLTCEDVARRPGLGAYQAHCVGPGHHEGPLRGRP